MVLAAGKVTRTMPWTSPAAKTTFVSRLVAMRPSHCSSTTPDDQDTAVPAVHHADRMMCQRRLRHSSQREDAASEAPP
jgi:hypothetical protein